MGCEPQRRLERVAVGVDPPASAQGDACGIVVCGMAADGIAYGLADLTVSGLRPEGWARRVAAAAKAWDAQKVVAEKNQGGDMVESVLLVVEASLPVKLAGATKSKAARAEPVALRFETGKARLGGRFPELEDELCAIYLRGLRGDGALAGPGGRDVSAMAEPFETPRAEPRIFAL